MRTRTMILPVLLLAAALLALGCGDDETTSTVASEDEGLPPAVVSDDGDGSGGGSKGNGQGGGQQKPERAGTTIELADSAFGEILFDGSGQAIYLFDKERTDVSECYGDCAVEWPPVLTEGDPQAKGGIAEGKLGTTERDDGTTQVTYNGHPLYYYFNEGPGIVGCHNVPGFGGLWLVLDGAGNAV